MNFGGWVNSCQTIGVEVSYLGVGTDEEEFNRFSTGTPILARPFFNVETGVPDASLVAFPHVVQGTFTANATTKFRRSR